MTTSFLDKQRKYWNEMAQKISDPIACNHWVDENNNPVNPRMFEEIACYIDNEFIQDKTEGYLLEIGCGNGQILSCLKYRLNNKKWKIFGADISETMLKRIADKDFVLLLCEASNIPCKICSFDLIYAHSVVQYFDNVEYLNKVLAELIRILKPGGSICLIDVPLLWYKAYMQSPSNNIVKMFISDFISKHFPKAYAFVIDLIKTNKVQIEYVNNVPINIPSFRGFYPDPDIFYQYKKYFNKVSIELQPFIYKPIVYRKFRFIISMKERNKIFF